MRSPRKDRLEQEVQHPRQTGPRVCAVLSTPDSPGRYVTGGYGPQRESTMSSRQAINSHGEEFAVDVGHGAEVEAVDLYQTSGTSPPNPMPSLAPDEYAGLKESIRRHGVLYPVVVDHEGAIIDGHHRLAIVREIEERVGLRIVVLVPWDSDLSPAKLKSKIEKAFPETRTILAVGSRSWDNADPPITYRHLRAGADPQEVACTLNLDRRHLTVEQRRSLVADLRERGTSIRAIATATGEPKSTVADDVKQLSDTGQLKAPAKVKGLDGKTRTAKPKKPPKRPEPPKVKAARPKKAPAKLTPETTGAEAAMVLARIRRYSQKSKTLPSIDATYRSLRDLPDAVAAIRGIPEWWPDISDDAKAAAMVVLRSAKRDLDDAIAKLESPAVVESAERALKTAS